MNSSRSLTPAFWRQVRWCDRHLDRFHRRILMHAWLPQMLHDPIPWFPLLPALHEGALTLARAPYRLVEPVPGQSSAFRPTALGTMVVWLHLLGQQPEGLRPGLHPLAASSSPPPARRHPAPPAPHRRRDHR